MAKDTRVCPYCAEDIKAAAIVCKHCGRELPGYEELKPVQSRINRPARTKIVGSSIWARGRKFGIAGFALLFLGVISRASTLGFTPEDVGTIIIGGIAVFLVFSMVGGGIASLWSNQRWDGIVIIGVIALLFIGGIYFLNRNEDSQVASNNLVISTFSPTDDQPTPNQTDMANNYIATFAYGPNNLSSLQKRSTMTSAYANDPECLTISDNATAYIGQFTCFIGGIWNINYSGGNVSRINYPESEVIKASMERRQDVYISIGENQSQYNWVGDSQCIFARGIISRAADNLLTLQIDASSKSYIIPCGQIPQRSATATPPAYSVTIINRCNTEITVFTTYEVGTLQPNQSLVFSPKQLEILIYSYGKHDFLTVKGILAFPRWYWGDTLVACPQ